MKIKLSGGFTLIELLVVISIMGILAAILFVSYVPAQKQARDAQRKSDIGQYQAALEGFANVNSDFYPSFTATISANDTLCPVIPKNISKCLDDTRRPDDATFVYNYQSNGTGSGTASATRYVIWGKLEYATDFWVTCSNGQKGYLALGSESSISGGNCPALSQTPSGISTGGGGGTTAPTSAPTSAPNSAPTVAPTSAPTLAPTVAPTVAPTSAPTSIPASTTYKRVFVTSTTYNGALNGLSGADANCQMQANSVPLGGTWKAWISTSTQSPANQLDGDTWTKATIPYKLVDGTTIANDWNDLITLKPDGSYLRALISKSESNTVPPATSFNSECLISSSASRVSTATRPDGTFETSAGNNCNQWLTGTSNAAFFTIWGETDLKNGAWTNSCNVGNCSRQSRLYCFEQ